MIRVFPQHLFHEGNGAVADNAVDGAINDE